MIDDKLIEQWNKLDARDVIKAIFETCGERAAIGTSLQKAGMVQIDMASKLVDSFSVFTLDTERLFPETLEFINAVENRYGDKIAGGKIKAYKPDPNIVTAMTSLSELGENLFLESAEKRQLCCYVRKVLPNREALQDMDVWITGLARFQSEFRKGKKKIQRWVEEDSSRSFLRIRLARAVQLPAAKPFELIKVSPLIDWDPKKIDAYLKKYDVPVHPLHEKGYPSIGCAFPCTVPVKPGVDPRKGRWAWEQGNAECGLHLGGGAGI